MIKRILCKANKPKKERNYRNFSWHQCQCSGSSQIPIQDDINYHQFLSLYHFTRKNNRTELIIWDTENKKDVVEDLNDQIYLDEYTSITQLPNGELFCYGCYYSGTTVIIDRSYRVRKLPSGAKCGRSSALYFDNNIYCFGGLDDNFNYLALSSKFDLKNNRWITLTPLPEEDMHCHSVIFNGNILISGLHYKNIWIYSIEIDSFSIIPYDFAIAKKILINVERLYLIEFSGDGLIYESEDEYHWKPISKSGEIYNPNYNIYCLYNKEKIYISSGNSYYKLDLKNKVAVKKFEILFLI